MVFRQITQPMPSTWRAIAITVGRVYAPTMKPMMASQKNQLLATGLPRHLAALVGALNGPSDLGRVDKADVQAAGNADYPQIMPG